MRIHSLTIASSVVIAQAFFAQTVYAQSAPVFGAAAPPADAKALVAGPKGPGDAPKIAKPSSDETNVNLSSGGLITTGNSKTLALTLNGQFDMRRGDNGVLVGLVGNYGESTVAPNPSKPTAQNVQGKLRYDRFFIDNVAGFLIVTGRHDRFQGIGFRLNLDPGVKVVAYKDDAQSFWVEGGYDFQFDARNDTGRVPPADAPAGTPPLDATRTDHSARGYLGYRRNFNSAVTFSTGVELLQSFVKTDLGSADTRVNFDANLGAKLDFGFSLGVGFTARYDRLPIPGKQQLDTSTTLSLLYAWSDAAAKKAEEKPCPECPTCPPPAPVDPAAAPAKPAPTTAPTTAPAPTSTP